MKGKVRVSVFLVMFFAVNSCQTLNYSRLSLDEVKSMSFENVNACMLWIDREKYQGKYIETEGRGLFGFEMSVLSSWAPATYDSLQCRLWLEFHPSYSYYQSKPDSIRGRNILIKGRFDTTERGHLGAYPAGIVDICELKILPE